MNIITQTAGPPCGRWPLLLSFFLLVSLCYYPSYQSKFTSDFLTWTATYEKEGWNGFLSNCFGDVSLKYVYHLLMMGLYKLFGYNPLGWYISCNFLHALNGCALLQLVSRLLKHLDIKAPVLPLAATLFFLLSPYQTEAVVWAAAIHFQFAATMMLTALLLLLRYYETGKKRYLPGIHISFVAGLLATEAIVILPLLQLVCTLLLARKSALRIRPRRVISGILLPALALLFGFFLFTYLKFGSPVGHYGTSMHLNADLSFIGVNCLKYLLKFIAWFRYLPFDHTRLLNYLDHQLNGLFILVPVIMLAVVLSVFFFLGKLNSKASLVLALWFCFLIALLPVINLETLFVKDIQSDRYGYIPSLFYYPFAAACICFIFRDLLRKIIIVSYIAFSLVCLLQTQQKWFFVGQMIPRLVNSFPHQPQGKIYVLNLADTYFGAYCLRMGFPELLTRKYGPEIATHVTILSLFNMYHPSDSVRVIPKGGNEYEVQACSWGGWMWGMPLGESPEYSITTDGRSMQYTIKFRELKKEDLILYQAGQEWHYIQH